MLLNVTLLDFDLASIQDFWQRQSSQYYRCLFIFPKPAGSSHVALSLRCGSTRPIARHFFRDPPCNIKCTSCGSRLAKHVVHGPKPISVSRRFSKLSPCFKSKTHFKKLPTRPFTLNNHPVYSVQTGIIPNLSVRRPFLLQWFALKPPPLVGVHQHWASPFFTRFATSASSWHNTIGHQPWISSRLGSLSTKSQPVKTNSRR